METVISSLFIFYFTNKFFLLLLFNCDCSVSQPMTDQIHYLRSGQAVFLKPGKVRAVTEDNWYLGKEGGDTQIYILTHPYPQINKQTFEINTQKCFNLELLVKMVPQTMLAFEGMKGLQYLFLGAHIGDNFLPQDISKPQTPLLCVPIMVLASLPQGSYYLVVFSFCICYPHKTGNTLRTAP